MPLRLEVIEGENLHKIYRIQDFENSIVGRSINADITFNDPLVSRKHCRIEVGAGTCQVIDLNSSNATRLNGRPVRGAVVVTGDEVRIGSHVLEATLETAEGVTIAPAWNLRSLFRRRNRALVAGLVALNVILVVLLSLLYVANSPGPGTVRCQVEGCAPQDPDKSFFCNVHGVALIVTCRSCGQEFHKNQSSCPRCRAGQP